MSEIFKIFLKLGLLGFGGPIAVMAMMEEEVCRKRKWLSSQSFAEMYAFLKIMPGPLSTQMAVYLGRLRAGVPGGLLAGTLFVFPSFLLLLVLSYFYLDSGTRFSGSSAVFSGLQAGALAVILLSTLQLSRPYRTQPFRAHWEAWSLALAGGALVFWRPRWEPLVILAAGALGAIKMLRVARSIPAVSAAPSSHAGGHARDSSRKMHGLAVVGGAVFFQSTLFQLFWSCFKAGAFVFGTGLAIVPLLEADVVGHFHWLTHAEFLDGLAMGQVTPGPVVITATFIGYKTAGILGAVLATVGIFLPCFINVLWIVPGIWAKFGGTAGAQGFAAWAIPAVIGAILATTLRLGMVTLTSAPLVGVFLVSGVIAVKFQVPAWLLIPLAGAMGGILQGLPG